jgi:hypothetical protein
MPYASVEDQRAYWRKRNLLNRGPRKIMGLPCKRGKPRDAVKARLGDIYEASKHRAKKGGYAPLDKSTVQEGWSEQVRCLNFEECGYEHIPGVNRRLAMDHCHKTGAYRAMLCYRCNVTVEILVNCIDGKHACLLSLIN